MMTKKDFEIIAGIIQSLPVDSGTRRAIAEAFALRLSKACPGFLYLRFYNLCFPRNEASKEISRKLLKIHDGHVIS